MTLQDLKNNESTIRLIDKRQHILNSQLQTGRSMPLNIKGHVQNLHSTALSVEFDPEVSKQAAIKNIEKIRMCTFKMHQKIDHYQDELITDLPNLSPDQQEVVVEYWQSVTSFLTDIFNYLKKMLNRVIDALKQGLQVAKDAFKEIFDEVRQWLAGVLNRPSN